MIVASDMALYEVIVININFILISFIKEIKVSLCQDLQPISTLFYKNWLWNNTCSKNTTVCNIEESNTHQKICSSTINGVLIRLCLKNSQNIY